LCTNLNFVPNENPEDGFGFSREPPERCVPGARGAF
jgi:hypothetical protein